MAAPPAPSLRVGAPNKSPNAAAPGQVTPLFSTNARALGAVDDFIPAGTADDPLFEIVGRGTGFACQAAAFEYAHARFRNLGAAWLATETAAAGRDESGGAVGVAEPRAAAAAGAAAAAAAAGDGAAAALAAAAAAGDGAAAAPRMDIEARVVDLSWDVKPSAAAKCGAALRSHLEKRLRLALIALFDADEQELVVTALHRLVVPMPPEAGFTAAAVAEGKLVDGEFFEQTEFVANCGDTSWLVNLSLDSVMALRPQRAPVGPKGGGGGWKPTLLGDVRATATARVVKATGFALSLPAPRAPGLDSLKESFAQMGLFGHAPRARAAPAAADEA